jgi:hypothetical protein
MIIAIYREKLYEAESLFDLMYQLPIKIAVNSGKVYINDKLDTVSYNLNDYTSNDEILKDFARYRLTKVINIKIYKAERI